jgi:hypothetical protein
LNVYKRLSLEYLGENILMHLDHPNGQDAHGIRWHNPSQVQERNINMENHGFLLILLIVPQLNPIDHQ